MPSNSDFSLACPCMQGAFGVFTTNTSVISQNPACQPHVERINRIRCSVRCQYQGRPLKSSRVLKNSLLPAQEISRVISLFFDVQWYLSINLLLLSWVYVVVASRRSKTSVASASSSWTIESSTSVILPSLSSRRFGTRLCRPSRKTPPQNVPREISACMWAGRPFSPFAQQ
jgi:hypothetical protein